MGVNLTKATNNCRIGSALVDGTTANTNIAVAGIKTTDQLIRVLSHNTKASVATITDVTSTCSSTSDGNIQCSGDTSNDQLDALWQSSE